MQEELISEKRKEGNKLAQDDFKVSMIRQTSKKAIEDIRNGKSTSLITRSKQKAIDIFFERLVQQEKDFIETLKLALNKGLDIHKQAAQQYFNKE